ncbi:flagellar export chaperone FliS [Deferribacterales bacterium Es71-Z0220]|jgi:flagellar protein FliS|uniref:flagellar export chaperone FliS n=1 Tax=Deferrivibrio essentukiensis TaxID=2880922 RepID=UPI001F613DBD|nr:flagellar export chaperone FliS [Deferrivibrio essentukiensis]MBZ4671966.1 flagellar protein FliS [Deferribacteraceae bacterium]MCB4204163.1 flagellar export chaperone FliS [Deferrivibrio essentukiensis]
MVSNPYRTYLKNEIEGATKGKLILLLYDGAIKFLRQANKYIELKDIPNAHQNIIKAENIIYELMSTLNMDAGEIAENLLKLYDFMVWQLIEANKEKNSEKINTVIKLLTNLREAWKVIVEKEQEVESEAENKKRSVNFAG